MVYALLDLMWDWYNFSLIKHLRYVFRDLRKKCREHLCLLAWHMPSVSLLDNTL